MIALVIPNPIRLKSIAQSLGKKSTLELDKLCQDDEIIGAVLNEIQTYAKQCGLLRLEIPAKIILIADEWSPASGHMTASMKIKRKFITDSYRTQINKLYNMH